MSERKRLEFRNLPLQQVVLRLVVAEPIPVNIRFITDLWSELRKGDFFTEIRAPQQVEFAPAVENTMSLTQSTPAEFWNENTQVAVAVFPLVLTAIWRRGRKGGNYPRFEALEEAMRCAIEGILSLTKLDRLSCRLMNLAYVNVIDEVENESGIIQRYLGPDFQIGKREQTKLIHELNLNWREDDNVDVRLELTRQVSQKDGAEKPSYFLATVAGCNALPTDNIRDLGLRLNDRLNSLFPQMISQEAQADWQLES